MNLDDLGKGWLPTPANINALPGGIRRYVTDLETRADPAGEVAQLILTQDENRQLRAKIAELVTCRGEVERILDGIDRTESDDKPGWWPTSEGAAFGAGKLREIIGILKPHESVKRDSAPVRQKESGGHQR